MDEEEVTALDLKMARILERIMLSAEERALAVVENLRERVDAKAEESKRNNEETQRNIEFIIQQQAQFNADMQQLREAQARSEQRWERTEGGIRALLSIAEIHQQEIDTLKESQAQTDRQMRETDERFKETGERLNALIDTVERVISERRNGGRASEGERP